MSHRWPHFERVETDAAAAIDVGVVDGRYEAYFGRFERIPVLHHRVNMVKY